MKVEIDEDGDIVLKEVFSGISLQTEEGNCLGVCMRDDTFEISMFKRNNKGQPKTFATWFRVDFANGTISPLVDPKACTAVNEGEPDNANKS